MTYFTETLNWASLPILRFQVTLYSLLLDLLKGIKIVHVTLIFLSFLSLRLLPPASFVVFLSTIAELVTLTLLMMAVFYYGCYPVCFVCFLTKYIVYHRQFIGSANVMYYCIINFQKFCSFQLVPMSSNLLETFELLSWKVKLKEYFVLVRENSSILLASNFKFYNIFYITFILSVTYYTSGKNDELNLE